jgi:hypothetical protein
VGYVPRELERKKEDRQALLMFFLSHFFFFKKKPAQTYGSSSALFSVLSFGECFEW